MFIVILLEQFLVYLRLFCECMGWKQAAKWIGKIVKKEPDLGFEKHVL